jgi:AcrR family transcriptional regulator
LSSPARDRPYGGRSSQERRSERRAQLLAAALELFARDGYAATSVEALCREAGLNTRYLYEQFDNREAVLHALYEQITIEAGLAVVSAIEAAPLKVRARCAAGAHAFADAMLRDVRYVRIAYVEVVGVSAALEERRRASVRANAALLEDQARRHVAAGTIPERDYRLTTIALMGAADELVVDWLDGPRDAAARDAVVEEMTEFYVAALTRGV